MSTYGGVEVQLTTVLKSTTDSGESRNSHPGRLISGATDIGTRRPGWGDPTAEMYVVEGKRLLPL